MPTSTSPPALFPSLPANALLSFQFSSWYPRFSDLTIKSTVIRPLHDDFRRYLDSDGVFVPEDSDNAQVESTLSDHEDEDSCDEADEAAPVYAFPELNAQIRRAIEEHGAVFPKLNFSAPKDAAWVLLASTPLKCTSPADVYMLLKSSDFVSHDLDTEALFQDCDAGGAQAQQEYALELVLRKWYSIDRSRELRCFVRSGTLIGITQRDTNYYDFWNDLATQEKVALSVQRYWESEIRDRWQGPKDYVFDILLTRNLERAHVIDFGPYLPRTDPLLFTYEELLDLFMDTSARTPQLRVIDSRSHPAATRNAPANQHNMVPFEAIALSSGADIEEFADRWRDEVQKAAVDD